MGFAHHCVYLNYYSGMSLEFRQYPKVAVTLWIADYTSQPQALFDTGGNAF